MGKVKAGVWRYAARYGWNWRSARAVSSALGSLALPMPPWFRMVVARGLLARTALRADAHGIWGSAWPRLDGPTEPVGPCPCPWKDVTDVVIWQYDHLRIIGLARRGDAVGSGPAASALASQAPQQARPARRRTQRRHPSYPPFIAADGSPYDIGNVLTTNGWCVDPARLRAVVRHFAPRARFTDLTGISVVPESGGWFGFPFEVLAGLLELIGWRRLGWLLGAAAAASVLAIAAGNLGTHGYAPAGVGAGALGLVLLGWRAMVARRRRRRSRHPEGWLESGRGDAGSSPLMRLRRGPLAAWMVRVSPFAGRRGKGTSARRSAYAIRRRLRLPAGRNHRRLNSCHGDH